MNEPKFNPNKVFTFNVGKPEYLVNPEIGEFSIVTSSDVFYDEVDFIPLDEEYYEEGYLGTEEEELIDTESLNEIKGFDPENPNEELSTDSDAKYPISKDTDGNIKAIISVAKNNGITNEYAIAAMLAICKKESGFIPRCETSYRNTSAKRIKEIFYKLRKYSDDEVDSIKKNDRQFFDIIYGGTETKKRYGNGPKDGYKYRGRGFNQITFKGNYEKYKDLTGFDIINDPDLLNTVNVAAKCLVEYFKSNFRKAPDYIKSTYNFSNINSFTNLKDATGAFYHANAGWGKSLSQIRADSTGGRAKAFNYVGPLYNTYLK